MGSRSDSHAPHTGWPLMASLELHHGHHQYLFWWTANPCLTRMERHRSQRPQRAGFTHRRQLIMKANSPLVSEKTKL